jgi:hypothetical protein
MKKELVKLRSKVNYSKNAVNMLKHILQIIQQNCNLIKSDDMKMSPD